MGRVKFNENLSTHISVYIIKLFSINFILNYTAAEKDLDIVKKLAYLQVREFGMNENVGQISFHFEEGDETLPKPYSKYMENMIDTVRKIDTYF